MVDPGSRRRVLEWLQTCHVLERILQEAVDPLDAVLPLGAEDVQGAWEEEVLVIAGGDDLLLEVDETGGENHAGSIAGDGCSASSHQVMTLVDAPMLYR